MIVAISGPPGAGKSLLAAELGALLHTRPASFGDYVRHLASERGADPDERGALQDLGEREVRADPAGFVDGFLRWSGRDLTGLVILDGLRHVEVRDVFEARAAGVAEPFVHVHVRATKRVRAGRRTGDDLTEMMRIDRHPVECDARGELARRADMVVSGAGKAGEIAARVAESFSKHLSNAG